jgi:hypothetical protein
MLELSATRERPVNLEVICIRSCARVLKESDPKESMGNTLVISLLPSDSQKAEIVSLQATIAILVLRVLRAI